MPHSLYGTFPFLTPKDCRQPTGATLDRMVGRVIRLAQVAGALDAAGWATRVTLTGLSFAYPGHEVLTNAVPDRDCLAVCGPVLRPVFSPELRAQLAQADAVLQDLLQLEPPSEPGEIRQEIATQLADLGIHDHFEEVSGRTLAEVRAACRRLTDHLLVEARTARDAQDALEGNTPASQFDRRLGQLVALRWLLGDQWGNMVLD